MTTTRAVPTRGPVGLLALAALLGCLAPGCARRETGATILRSSRLAVLPKESVALVVVEVKSLRSVPAFGRWLDEVASAADREATFRAFRERLGPDALAGLDRVGFAVVPLPGGAVGYGLVAEGTLDETKLREALGGQETLSLLQPEGRPDLSVTVLKGGSLAFGPRQVLEIVRANAGRPAGGIGSNALMVDLLETVRPDSHLWGAVDFRTLARLGRQAAEARAPGAAAAPQGPISSSLVALTFQGRIGSSFDLDLAGRADGEAGARKLADAARGLLAIGRIGASPDQAGDWLALLDGIAIDQTGREVRVHVSVPQKAMLGLAEKARSAAEAMPAAPQSVVAPPAAGPAPGPLPGHRLPRQPAGLPGPGPARPAPPASAGTPPPAS